MEEKEPQQEQEREPVRYASPAKRLLAWVGLAYALLFLFLNTYNIYTGRMLVGIAGLGLAPALFGLGALAVLRYRAGRARGGLAACVAVAGAAFLLGAWNLIRGVAALVGQL